MRVVRYAALIALAVWVGGLITVGAIVAPAAFDVAAARNVAAGRLFAGEIAGAIFARFHLVAYAAAAVLLVSLVVRRLLGPKPVHFGVRVAVLLAMAGMTCYSGRVLVPEMGRTLGALGVAPSDLAADDPGRVLFERLHGRSVALQIVALAGGLLLLGYEAAES